MGLSFTFDEVVRALNQVKRRKTSEPDGLQAYFLCKYWHILSNKVTSMVLGILNNGEDISHFNDTNIALILKIKNPALVKDYRLIGLCNVIYKLISKIIVNPLKSHMSTIIHNSQSVFVEKRLITDNFIIAFEAFHSMNFEKINGSNHFALKLDISKAFDKVK